MRSCLIHPPRASANCTLIVRPPSVPSYLPYLPHAVLAAHCRPLPLFLHHGRVVAGMVDPDPRTAGSGLRRLADQGLDVTVGVEGAACQAVNCAFVHRVSEKVTQKKQRKKKTRLLFLLISQNTL